ncbi:uncharacterized protein LOC143623992 [Bidens hawaiensis]|uniref:uncharacterized protein LOC143623992 n=1 Tax=Bidens hawaiensis TaxID=980011 RepID=UPI00404A3F3D
MFRSTVWVDGVSYTSSNTFRQRKNAEMDASRVAYIAIMQKDKTDALNFIREDKLFCKSVMAEYAAKKNIGRPVYETSQPEAPLPVFRSNLVFNGDTYPGDSAKSKKEAEQLVARSVIISFLASESGTDMADVVNSKFRQYQQISNVQVGSNAAVVQPIIPQPSAEQTAPTGSVAAQQVSTMLVNRVVPVVTQQMSVVAEPLVFTPVPSVLVNNSATANVIKIPKAELDQQPISQVLVEPIKPVVAEPLLLNTVSSALINNSAVTNVMKQPKAEPDQQPVLQVSIEPINSVVAEPLVFTPYPSAVVYNSAPANVMKQPKAEPYQQPFSQVLVKPIESVVAEPLVLNPVPSALINNSANANVIKQPKAEPDQAMEFIPLVDQASDKKRSSPSNRNARKKMRGSIE